MSNRAFSLGLTWIVWAAAIPAVFPASVYAGCESDVDGDGICDSDDQCPNTIPGVRVFLTGCPTTAPGDFDEDGDVDAVDYTMMFECVSGPTVPTSASPPCPDADFDFDGDVDIFDVGAFGGCFSGEDRPADPNCVPRAVGLSGGCLQIIGTGASGLLALRLHPTISTILFVDFGDDGSADFIADRGLFNCIEVFARGGRDQVRIDETNGAFTSSEITTLDGGSGDDVLLGGAARETFIGGDGDDFIDGRQGNDVALMGAGDDVFQWDPGDGSDSVDGEGGFDVLVFNGSNADEVFNFSANGGRLRLIRDLGSVLMDLDVEQVELQTLGGTDQVTVNALAATGTTRVHLDLAAILGGSAGDGLADSVIVNGTADVDEIDIEGSAGTVELSGLGPVIQIASGEASLDRLTINALGQDDFVQASALAPGAIALTLNGGSGNDELTGGGGPDILNGEGDNDLLIGGGGDDQMFGGPFNDRMIWNPGDGSDLMEGGDGLDVVGVFGGNGAEVFSVTANGTRVRFDRLDPAPFALDIGTCETLFVNCNGGHDSLSCTGNLAVLIAITADGGAGNDTLLGSNGVDLLLGGDGNDFIDGQQGNDTVLLGAGDDVFQWDPGDGSDTVEGQGDSDTLLFNGSGGNENLAFSADGERLRFTRDLGNITMDCDSVEEVDLNALGGADTITINSLADTDVLGINVNLAGTLGGGAGDAQADHVIVNGTEGTDNITIAGGLTGVVVSGLAAFVNITTPESAFDRLTINALDAGDSVTAAGLGGGVLPLTLNGGTGDDSLIGSGGADIIDGGGDQDTLRGGDDNDTLLGGLGDDHLIWNPGDDTDLMEGGDGVDTVEVNGGNGDEVFSVTANGTRVRFDRLSPAPFSIDIGTAENLLTNCHGGNDSFSTAGSLVALIAITVDGGAGDDTLLGSNGIDILIGGDNSDFIDGQQGNDVAFLGGGDDVFQWDPGDGSDTIEGQTGFDTLAFNGSAGNEIFDVSADGERVRLTRNLGNIVMDCNDLERVDLRALGGADTVVVNALDGTDVVNVDVALAGTVGGTFGDAQADIVTAIGTSSDDVVLVNGSPGGADVLGLAVAISISTPEPANDRLTLSFLAGDDTLDASGLLANVIQLTAEGGDDNDTLIGSDGADILLGGDGDDVLIGGLGVDVLDGGTGDNIIIQ